MHFGGRLDSIFALSLHFTFKIYKIMKNYIMNIVIMSEDKKTKSVHKVEIKPFKPKPLVNKKG
jgi:Holliday junction resolvasome RuvABC ATP-dependent DNA helicase subunit